MRAGIVGDDLGSTSADEIRKSKSEEVQQFLTGREEGPVSFHYPAPSVEDDYLERRGSL